MQQNWRRLDREQLRIRARELWLGWEGGGVEWEQSNEGEEWEQWRQQSGKQSTTRQTHWM